MRITLPVKLSLAMAIIIFSSTLFGAHIPPVRTLRIPYATDGIYIDGNGDEVYWSPFQSTEVFRSEGYSGVDDFELTFKVCYDQSYLFLFAQVKDDYESDYDWNLSNPWSFDCIELLFDLDTTGSGIITAYDSNTVQLRFCRGIDSVENPGRAKRSDFIYYWENTAIGWNIEVAIPWTFVLGRGQSPEDIMQYFEEGVSSGFDLMGSDSDADGPDNRDCQTAWDNDDSQIPLDWPEDNAWNNRSVFGVVDFMPVVSSIGSYLPPVEQMIIPPKTSWLEIDGSDTDHSYSFAQSLTVFNNEGISNSDDLSGFFKATWDKKYLYFYSEIKDNIQNIWTGIDSLEGLYDNLAIYIDLDTNRNSSKYDEDAQIFRFYRGIDTLTNYGKAGKDDFIIFNRNTNNNLGWVLEAAIPWTGIMPEGSTENDFKNYYIKSFGFDIIVNDADGDSTAFGKIDGQLAWDMDEPDTPGDRTEISADTNIFALGIVKLTGIPIDQPQQPEKYCYPTHKGYIPQVVKSPVQVDGIMDEDNYSTVYELYTFNNSFNFYVGDLSASLSFCWDTFNLYLYVDINDDLELSWSGSGDLRDYDNVEVYIDLDTSNTDPNYGETTLRLLFNRGYNSIVDTGRATRSAFNVYSENKTIGSGWILEAAIPWSCVLPLDSVSAGITEYLSKWIGFDVHVNDCDGVVSNNERPDKQVAWDVDDPSDNDDQTENFISTNRYLFGLAQLTNRTTEVEEIIIPKNSCLLMPNPANSLVSVSNLANSCTIVIINMYGQRLTERQINSDTEIFDISDFTPGIYFIRIIKNNQQSETLTFIKQ